jgi:hypothetical protein
MRILRTVLLASGVAGAAVLFGNAAQAMPIGQLNADQSAKAENVALVCNQWGRCWHRPSFYRSYGFYRPAPVVVVRPWWRRHHHWRHWHHW